MWNPQALPDDTAHLILPSTLRACHNLGLLLDRFQPWQRISQTLWELPSKVKGQWFSRQLDVDTKVDSGLLAAQHARWQRMVMSYGASDALRFDLVAVAPLVVGLGADNVLETAICLQRIVGQPVIPGSALKGIARTLALCTLAEALGVPIAIPEPRDEQGDSQKKLPDTPLRRLVALLDTDLNPKEDTARNEIRRRLTDLQCEPTVAAQAGPITSLTLDGLCAHDGVRQFRAVFGFVGCSGHVRFFDALPRPDTKLSFRADVMNVHYSQYYRTGGGESPHDYDKLSPVAFLTIAPGAGFSFAVAPLRSGDVAHASVARCWLEQALREIGVGAKTSAGYGLFGDKGPIRAKPGKKEPQIPPSRTPKPAEAPLAEPSGFETGRVKFYKNSDVENYGFIVPDSGDKDIYVRINVLRGDTPLYADQRVRFVRQVGTDGREQAYDVQPLN